MAATRPMTHEEESAVLAALEQFPPRTKALALVMQHTGYRISEILSLNCGSVWENGRIKARVSVERANLKGGHGMIRRSVKARTVPLNPRAIAALENYFFSLFGSGGPDDLGRPLFVSRNACRLSRNQAARDIHALFVAAGLSNNCRGECGTHVLRKTFCQKIYHATGNDINATRAIVGHRHITTTQAYLHVSQNEMDAAVIAIGRSEGPEPHVMNIFGPRAREQV